MKCQAEPVDPACTGTYTEDCCTQCAALEGERCMNKEQKTGRAFADKSSPKPCVGPFDASTVWRCSDCSLLKKQGKTLAMWRAVVEIRRKKDSWRKELPYISKVKEVYDTGDWDNLTPASIDSQYAKEVANGAAHEWCPWIKFGNLYATVTTGNDAGWRILVQKHLEPNASNPRVINVFTGRHGNPEGTITKENTELFADGKVMDPNHYLQDIIQKAVLDGKYTALPTERKPRIKLWDVGTTQGSTMTKTRMLAAERLKKGEIVIFAWCWSLLSFYKVTVQEAMGYSKYDDAQAYNQPIKQIVRAKYGWATTAQIAPSALGDSTVKRLKAAIEATEAATFKNSTWRMDASRHGQKTEKVMKDHYAGGISEQKATSDKGSISTKLKEELNRISPVHYH